MSFIGNYLKENNKLPCFANYYGGFNGIIDEFSYDITEEFHSFKNENWFNTTIGRIFSIDVYHSDSESEDDMSKNEEDIDTNTTHMCNPQIGLLFVSVFFFDFDMREL